MESRRGQCPRETHFKEQIDMVDRQVNLNNHDLKVCPNFSARMIPLGLREGSEVAYQWR